jgi:hypothetical protein
VPIDDVIDNLQDPKIIAHFVPVNDDDIDVETNETFNVYHPDGKFSVHNGGQEITEALQELIYDAIINHHDVPYQQNLLKESIADYKDDN